MEEVGLVLVVMLVVQILAAGTLWANGGPFVVKYPNGDPAAKGVLARLDPDLKPARETRLRVAKEDLKVAFGKEHRRAVEPPLVHVVAEYTIENPTAEDVEVDFGFPILRGVYMKPDYMSFRPRDGVQVRLGTEHVECTIISNSAIYGIIRQRARDLIDKTVEKDQALAELVASVRSSQGEARQVARRRLRAHLTKAMKWEQRNAALMLEYASLIGNVWSCGGAYPGS
jgi:hypothetical protein